MEKMPELKERIANNLERTKRKRTFKMPDKTRMKGEVIDEFIYPQSDLSNECVFWANLIEFEPYQGRPIRYEIRLGYWVIGSKPGSETKGKWLWGQFCPLLPVADMQAIYKEMEKRGWFEKVK